MAIFEQAQEQSPSQEVGAFLRAWGSDVPDGTRIFQETSEEDGMPQELYVLHDAELIHQIDESLEQSSVGLTSPLGSGKTALREIMLREFGQRDDYVLTHLGGGASETMRGIVVSVVRSLLDEGFAYDEESVGQIVDGVPWKTEDCVAALDKLTTEAAAGGGRKVVVIADQSEKYDERQLEALQSILDVGVKLLVMGTPRGRETVADEKPALESRMTWIERGIKPFEPGHTAEYIAKSLAYAADEPYGGPIYDGEGVESFVDSAPTGPFVAGAAEAITDLGDGNPRLVRLGCLWSLSEAARTWDDQEDVAAEDVPVTRELVERANDRREWATGRE